MARRRRRGRDVNGILALDKPVGLSSNQALQRVRYLLDARKAGHTGSLDPLASGVLPLCFGEATKVSGQLLDSDKVYEFDCRLGERTMTGDTEGEVVERLPVPTLSDSAIQDVLKGFLGHIEQTPPMYSALKHQGERLYELARRGLEVERKPRRIFIHSLELTGREGNELLRLRVHCSKGSYVRVLAEDLARALGSCGHVTRLRRVAAGPYGEADLVSLEALESAAEEGPQALAPLLQPVDSALRHWPEVVLGSDAGYFFKQGQAVMAPSAPSQGTLRVYAEGGHFLGLGEVLDDGRVAPRRLIRGRAPVVGERG